MYLSQKDWWSPKNVEPEKWRLLIFFGKGYQRLRFFFELDAVVVVVLLMRMLLLAVVGMWG